MKHFHWLRALNYSKMQSEHRTRPRNDQTSNRYPVAETCSCGVKTARAIDGRIRPHEARFHLRIKHHNVSLEAQVEHYTLTAKI
jgi:hypothetical protein